MSRKASKTVEDNVVTIEFVNDETLAVALTDLPDDIKTRLACHGLSQKLGDSYAGAETIDDAVAAATRVRDELIAGNWTAARAAGGGAVRVTMLAEALARVATQALRAKDATAEEITIEKAREVLGEMDDDQKKAIRSDAGIQKATAEIKLERAQKKAEEALEKGESDIGAMFG